MPGRDDRRARPYRPHGGRAVRQRRERVGRVGTPSGATAITPPSTRPARPPPPPRCQARRRAARRRGAESPSRLTWTRQVSSRPAARAAAPSARTRREPVHRVHDIRVPGHAARLVGLQLADEVPGDRPGRRRPRPWAPPPVSVLADVADAEAGTAADIGGGPRLGDRDQRDLGRSPVPPRRTPRRSCRGPRRGCGASSARRRGARPGSAHLRKSGTSRSSSSSKTTGRRRPARSRRRPCPLAATGSFQLGWPAPTPPSSSAPPNPERPD